ncbi:hypothetical protein [Sodalis glossinidius]|uniref:hypothetical protein n=1 Tax=Sodalis glossinidius TaxID=63612 RepID=UPI0018E0AAEB|nr:hypothetical protein [Sodalis glossinidius]
MQRAWKRLKANKGAAGVDGLSIAQTGQHLKYACRPSGNKMVGTYRPQPVRRVGIPKPDGSERELGIPTVIGRLHVNDAGVIRLVRAYLNAGIMKGGVVVERAEGTPQGCPLSPLLTNVLLDEVDRA